MNDEIEITTKVCHAMSSNGDSCNNVILKVPQSEAVKLQTVVHSNNENQGFSMGDFSAHADSFGFSFGLVLIFYLIAKSVGIVLTVFK